MRRPAAAVAVRISFADSGRLWARPVRAPLGSLTSSDTLRFAFTDALTGPSRKECVTGLPCLRLAVVSVSVPLTLTRAASLQRTLS